METRRDIFQAIADPTRRAVLLLIAAQSMTPKAIAQEFQTSGQAFSKHIQILTACDLLKQEQRRREIYYHLNTKQIHEISKWVEQFKTILEDQFTQLDKVLLSLKNTKDEK